MKQIIFTNINYPGNVGDYWSSPLKYYNFDFDYKHIHYLDIWRGMNNEVGFEQYDYKDCLIIIGGGGLISDKILKKITDHLVKNNDVIFWGVGSNTIQEFNFDMLNHENVKLSGVRDIQYGLDIDYLPCVSCKHPLINTVDNNGEGVGIYEHIDSPINIDGFDRIKNNESIKNVINFIKSKETIITTTYHGVYWSQLLNKKVLFYSNKKINCKIKNLKNRVIICNENDYKDKIDNIGHCVGMLRESRNLNDIFYRKVLDYVKAQS